MKPASRNRFLAHSLASVSITVAALLGNAYAIDYNYGSVTENFSITASDQARVLGGGITASGTLVAGNGAVYDRGSDRDATYMHFNLASLSGVTINGDVNLNLTVSDQYGGAINNGVIGTATSAWTTSSAAPGISTFTPVAAPNQTFANGATATWTISNATFTGSAVLADLANFNGLGITAGASSTAHFSALATLTGNYTGGEIRVTDGTDWSAASWDNGTKTLNISGTSDVTGGNVAMATDTTLSLSDSATLGGGSFAGSIHNSGTLAFGSSANQTLSGAISSTGALEKNGTGTLTLNGSISYKGGTTVNGGTLEMPGGDWNTGDPWGPGGANGAITVGSGAVLSTSDGVTGIKNGLTLNGGTVSSRGLTYDGSWGNLFLLSNITAGETATSTIASQINLSGNRTITVDTGSTLNVTGKVNSWNSGGAGIIKEGTGTLVLSSANGYSGVTEITAGTLVVTNSSALGESGWSADNMTWVRDGATLVLQGSVSINDHMHMFGDGVDGLGAIRSLSGDNALTMTFGNSGNGPGFSIDSNTTIGVDADSLTVTGFYETGGSFGITKVGAGTLALTQPSTYTGNTLITGGKIALGNASALQNSAFDTASVNGGLDVTGYATPTLGGLTGSVNLSPTLITGYGSVTGLTLNPQAGITQTYSGVISSGAPGMTLTKTGAGIQVLTGNNSYTGDTLIQGGTLEFSGGTSTVGNLTTSGGGLTFSGSSVVTGGTLHFQSFKPELTISDNADVTLTGGITHQPSDVVNPYHAANYNFLGGILRTPSISGPSIVWNQAGASMHFDGTRIVATTDNADFITTIGWDPTNTINLRSTGGAIFDTAGFDIGIQVVMRDEFDNDGNKLDAGKLTKLGTGTLTLSAINTYTGDTTIEDGTLNVAQPNFADTSTVTIGSTGGSPAVLELPNAGTDIVAALIIDGVAQSGDGMVYDSTNSGGAITGDGMIQVGTAPVTGYDSWASGKPGFTDTDTALDPDNDGIKNLLEYVLNGNPMASDMSILPSLSIVGTDFVFSFTRRLDSAGDTAQTFETSTNLSDWTTRPPLTIPASTAEMNDGTIAVGPATGTSPDEVQVITITVPKGVNTKLFGRLQVVK